MTRTFKTERSTDGRYWWVTEVQERGARWSAVCYRAVVDDFGNLTAV